MTTATRFGRAQGVLRREDRRFLTGLGNYTDDIDLPGQAQVAIVRSPYARARIVAIDKSAAENAPGVLGVYSGADALADGLKPFICAPGFNREDGKPATSPPRYPLSPEIARFVGDPVCAVVAKTAEQARDAAEMVTIEYEELEPLLDLSESASDSRLIAPDLGTNSMAFLELGDKPGTDAAFAAARHVVKLDIYNQRLVPNPIEPRVCIGKFSGSRYTVRVASQNASILRNALSATLGVPPEAIHVLVADIGGGFGMKTFIHPEDALVAWLARKVGCPVKWRGDRSEAFLGDSHGRDHLWRMQLALDANGRFTGLRVDQIANLGGYVAMPGNVVPLRAGIRVLASVYDITALHYVGRTVLTNTAPISAYRGAGRPEAIFAWERLIEVAARETGIEAVELRRRNLVPKSAMPYKTALGEIYDCGNFREVMEQAMKNADWNGFDARRAESRAAGRLRGRGLAVYVEWTGADMTERSVVEVHGDGRVVVLSGTQNMGQGLETSYAQLVSEALGVSYESIEVVQGDTDRINGLGSVASRSLFVGGSAAVGGANDAIDKGKPLAAEKLEAAPADIEYALGKFRIAGTDRTVGFFDLAKTQPQGVIAGEATVKFSQPSWPNGCYVVEVEIDPDTGIVTIARLTGFDDVGRVVNPMIVEGQVHGGLAQGIGQALMEHCIYEKQSGQLVTGSFMDYCMPRADDLPDFSVRTYDQEPSTGNPLGTKGVGEIGAVGGPPAVINAVVDALKEYGVKHLDMPVRAEDVWRIIAGRKLAA